MNRMFTLLSFLVASQFALQNPTSAKDSPEFRAGAAVADITPPLGLPIVGNWDSPPATFIHDKLHVRCLVLSDGVTKVAFAICDNVGIPSEVFNVARRLIADAQNIDPANVLMAATHTHSAVSARNSRTVEGEVVLDSYQNLVAQRIAAAVNLAVANLQPAQIGWGSVDEASEVHNRRWYVSDDSLLANPFGGVDRVRMNPPAGSSALVRPAGPVDPEVSFISVQTLDGKPICLLANYSLHYVGGVPQGHVSADYFGAFAEKIGMKLGGDESFVGILSNGTSGDVNNIRFTEKGFKQEPYQRIDEVAELIATRVAAAVSKIAYHDWIRLGAKSEALTLRTRKPDDAMRAYFEASKSKPTKELHRHELEYARRVQTLAEGPDTTTISLQAIRIGDLGISAIPFEVFTETGLQLKQDSPFSDTFTIELAGGSYGYLPTLAQHELGGYETWMGTNKVQLDASDRITEVLLRLLKSLQSL